MRGSRRSGLVGGLLLILLGLLILGVQLLPGAEIRFVWPWIVIGLGLLLLLLGAATGVVILTMPASIIVGIGGILYYQTVSGDWDSWAYIWSLIPGFVGVGILLFALMGGHGGVPAHVGRTLILISLVLFSLFGSLFGALGFMGDYWPTLLILLGLIILLWPLLGVRR